MKAIILAGGRGTRLKPYTAVFPKPLVPVGDMPILEIVIRQLAANGFDDITLAVGHLASLIQTFFQDGSKLGVKISYSFEDKPLGTSGPIALVPNIDDDFLVMNGDLLTTLNYTDLYRKHRQEKAICSIAVHTRDVKIDMGVLDISDQSTVVGYNEKPTLRYKVCMGIYVFSPRILEYIPRGEHLDLNDLVTTVVAKGEKVYAYQNDAYWLDIGRHDDYSQAIEEFESKKHLFLPGFNGSSKL